MSYNTSGVTARNLDVRKLGIIVAAAKSLQASVVCSGIEVASRLHRGGPSCRECDTVTGFELISDHQIRLCAISRASRPRDIDTLGSKSRQQKSAYLVA